MGKQAARIDFYAATCLEVTPSVTAWERGFFMAFTFLLDSQWDLTLDGGGSIATVSGGYAIAQNVANAIRLFTGDAYFNRDRGIPHFDIELGHVPPLSVLRSRILQAAKEVEGVADASITFDTFEGRVLSGTLILTTVEGETINVNL